MHSFKLFTQKYFLQSKSAKTGLFVSETTVDSVSRVDVEGSTLQRNKPDAFTRKAGVATETNP